MQTAMILTTSNAAAQRSTDYLPHTACWIQIGRPHPQQQLGRRRLPQPGHSPYSDGPEAVLATGERLQGEGAEAVLLDCIGFTERHRDTLAALDMPVILSSAVVAKAVGELFGG
jgi:AroM protein